MNILNTQQVAFHFPQEPMPPSFAKHSDRDNRLSFCACSIRVPWPMTPRPGTQDAHELVHIASGLHSGSREVQWQSCEQMRQS